MTTKSPDPSDIGSIFGSSEVAEQWQSNKAGREKVNAAANEMLLDVATLRPGDRVLDVAAGTGDQTLMAARRVGPTGYVLATDISASMLKLASDAAREAGLMNVEIRVMDAENIDLDENSFDSVICRQGLMLFPNPVKALIGMRQVVRAGGKVVVLVFSAAEKNPYEAVARTVAHRHGRRMPPLFSLGEQRLLENTFRSSGFSDFAVHVVATHRRFSSIREAIENLKDDFHGRSIIELPEAERQQAWEEVEQHLRRFEVPNGCELNGELLIGVGTK